MKPITILASYLEEKKKNCQKTGSLCRFLDCATTLNTFWQTNMWSGWSIHFKHSGTGSKGVRGPCPPQDFCRHIKEFRSRNRQLTKDRVHRNNFWWCSFSFILGFIKYKTHTQRFEILCYDSSEDTIKMTLVQNATSLVFWHNKTQEER